MLFIKQKMIYRSDLKNNPDILYVFGDNMQRVGMGGQAKEMRGEPNALGIPTKVTPAHGSRACYMSDSDSTHWAAVRGGLDAVYKALECGNIVIWPSDGIGTGLAELKTYAPGIAALIEDETEIFHKWFAPI